MASADAQVYFASLFAKCDPRNVGRVKVSSILDTMRSLQVHVSEGLDETCSEELLRDMKRVLDPLNEDPEITLTTFTERFAVYLDAEKKRLGEGEAGSTSNSQRRRSRTSVSDGNNNAGFAGDEVSDTESMIFNDLKSKVADLTLQVRRLSEDNTNLRSNLDSAQEENFSLLQAQKEDNEKKSGELRLLSEKVKQLNLTLADKDFAISCLEGKKEELEKKNSSLESELLGLQKDLRKATDENEGFELEMKKMMEIIASKDEIIILLKEEHEKPQNEWQQKEKDLRERNQSLALQIEELEISTLSLSIEKIDFEAKIAQLTAEIEDLKGKQESISKMESDSSPGNENDPFSTVEDVALETEIIAAAGDQNFPSLRKCPITLETPVLKFDAATQSDGSDLAGEKDRGGRKRFSSPLLPWLAVCSISVLLSPLMFPLKELIGDGCFPTGYFKGLEQYFATCGELSHEYIPII